MLKATTAIETSNEFLTGVLNSLKINPYTDLLSDSDDFRDDTYVGGKNVAEGFTHYVFDEVKKAAAERIVAVIRRHGWSMQDYKYQDQSSATNSLIKELRLPECQADLNTLGMMDWFNALVKSQEDFETVYNDKASHESKKESVQKKKAKLPVIEDIQNLVIYLNSIIIFNTTDESWTSIYNSINGILKQATKSSRIRRSGKSKRNNTISDENKVDETNTN